MVDTPTTRNRLRKQELGTNTNTWGDVKLNQVIDAIDQALDGVESIALSGDKVLTSTNYTTADENLNRVLKFTGSLTSAANVTVASVEHWYLVVNAAGAQVTVKTAAGSGVAVADGATALVYCDGSDVLNGAPTVIGSAMTIAGALTITGALGLSGKITGVTAGTAATDAVNKTQMDAAIAAASASGVNGTVKVDANASAAFLIDALTASGSITITDNGDSLDIGSTAVDSLALTDGGDKTADFTAAVNTKYTVDTASAVTATMPAAPGKGDIVVISKYGTGTFTLNLNGLKYYGSTTNPASTNKGSTILVYTDATDGWIDL